MRNRAKSLLRGVFSSKYETCLGGIFLKPMDTHVHLYLSGPPPPPPGLIPGGGGTSIYVCILGMCRKRDPHFQPWISVPEHIIFTNYQKIRSGASPFYIFAGFCRSGDHHFQNFFNINPFIASHGLGSARSAAPRLSGHSGAPHFQAQNGSSSFRRPPFSRSTGPELVPEPLPFFHFARGTYLPKFGVSTPPPPPPGYLWFAKNILQKVQAIYAF